MEMNPVPVIMDTDIGDDVDDAYALVFLALREELELKGVTTSHGDTIVKARIVAKLLRLLGRKDALIGAGPSREMEPHNQGPFVKESDPEAGRRFGDFSDVWSEVFDSDTWLVMTGPATNGGAYFARSGVGRPAGISFMGGEQEMSDFAEYNVRCDPQAFATTLGGGLPFFQGAYTPTRKVQIGREEVEALRASGRAWNAALAELTDLWWPHRGQKTGPVLYDVCPIAWLFAPDLFLTHEGCLEVATSPGEAFGRTREVPGEPNAIICDDLDADAIRAMVIQTLLG